MPSVTAVILAKYTAAAVLMTVSYWVSFFAAYGYTAYLWPAAHLPHVPLAAFFLWVIGFLYLSLLILGCVLFRQTFTSILFAGGTAAVISLLGLVKPLAEFNPFILTSKNVDLIAGSVSPSEFVAPMAVSLVITVVGLLLAVRLFNKKQL